METRLPANRSLSAERGVHSILSAPVSIHIDQCRPLAYDVAMKTSLLPITVVETSPFLRDVRKLMGEEMSGRRIVEGMKEAIAIARGELPEESYRVHIPECVDVKAIREHFGLSWASFSARFGLSLHALRNREQGKRHPNPAARAPDTVRTVLADKNAGESGYVGTL